MKAYKEKDFLVLKQPDDTGALVRVPSTPRFVRFEGCIAPLEPTEQDTWSDNWLAVGAEQEDGVLVAFEEHSGDLHDVGNAAISAKDRLLIERIYLTEDRKDIIRDLRNVAKFDGLCGYEATDYLGGVPLYSHDDKHWPDFRSRSTTAAILPPSSGQNVDYQSAYDHLRFLAKLDRFQPRPSLQTVPWLLRQRPPLDKLLLHPLLRALCWLLTMMERTRVVPTTQQQPVPDVWYGNPR